MPMSLGRSMDIYWRNKMVSFSNYTSPSGQLDKTDWEKIAKGAGIAAAGAVLTYLSEAITTVEFGVYTAVAVSVFSVLINAGLKWVKDNS
jgi:hypothetical protein